MCRTLFGSRGMTPEKRARIVELINEARHFRFCGQSDDSDQVTAVTITYRHLLVQLKQLAAPLLPEAEAAR